MGSTSPAGLPDELVRALAPLRALVHGPRNSVLPIVGSGLSSGALPSWWKLLDDLIGEAEPDLQPELRELLAKDRYLEVASLLEDSAAGKARVLAYIKRTFARPAAPPPSIYTDVAALPVDHFATTNYDPWLKDAVARARGLAPRVHIPTDKEAFSDLAASSDPLVLMLHGDAARPSECVLSQRAYRKLQFHPAYRAGMAALAAQRTLLFIGHSLSDPDLLAVLAEWSVLVGGPVTVPRHYFLGVGLDRVTRLRLAELGVTPIEYGARGDHSRLPAVLTHLAEPLAAPAAPPSTPRVAARPRVLLAGPHFGLPPVVRQTLEANEDWSAEQIRAYLTDQPELHRAHLAAILRYDLIVDASPWQAFRRWLSVGFRDLEEVLTPGFTPRDPPDATVVFLHDDARTALETRLMDLRARFPELEARLLAAAGEGLAVAGVDDATRETVKPVFDLLGGPREVDAPKAGDLVTPTAADYLRAVRVVAGQVRLPGDTDYRPLENVFVELSLYRESPAARPPREAKPHDKPEAKPDAKLEAKPDPAGETLADSGDDDRALREAEARPTPEPAARVDAKGLLVAAPRAYLEGAAGTGKSTLVRWQAVLGAQAARTSAAPWPLWIELSQLRTGGDLHAALLDAAFAALHLAPSGPARAELSERLSDGRVVLLLDALDEATTAARNLVVTQIVTAFPTSSLLLSSRPIEAADAVAAALIKVRLTGLTPSGTSDFLRVYFGERPWREEFLAALAGLPGGERWRETPLLLALAATHVAAGRRLPRHTLTLYDEVIDRLLERARSRVGAAPTFTAQARHKLEELAAGALLPEEVKPRVAIAPGELPSGTVGDVIRASGLFFGTSSLRFAHLTLGEYLAACGAVRAARPSRANTPTATPDSAAQAVREETLALLDRTHCLDDEAIPIALARAGEATLTAALADATPDPDHRRLRALLRALTYGGDGALAFGRAQGRALAERISRAMCPPSGRYSDVERRMVRDAERALLALEEVPDDAWRAFESLHRATWPVGLDAHLLGWALGAPWPLPPSPRGYLSGMTLRTETERLAAAFLRASPRRPGAQERREGILAAGYPLLPGSERRPAFRGPGRSDPLATLFASLANAPDSRAALRAKLDDENWPVRHAAVAALANDPDSRALLRAKLDDEIGDVRSVAVAALANDPDSRALLRDKLDDEIGGVRCAAVAALANDPDSRALLRAKLKDPRADVRRAAVAALANDPDSRALLRDKLNDESWDVRGAAVAALANDPDSRALLRDKLNDELGDVRSAAFAALANDPDSRSLLRLKLSDPDEWVRIAAVDALANAPDSRAALRAKLDDENWPVRHAAVAALANDPDSRALLRDKLNDPDNHVRHAAVAALANDPDSRALLREKLNDPRSDVRRAAVAALANDPDSRALLRDKFNDPDNDVRSAAVAALANDPDSRALLRDKLNDPDNHVRHAAVAALANDPDSRARLREKLNDPRSDVRRAAVAALANDPDSRALLRDKFNDPDNDVRSAAVAALANDPDSRALLRATLDDPDDRVRVAAVAALANDPDARPLLRDTLNDPRSDVRVAAVAALANDLDSRALLRDKLNDPRSDVRRAAVAALANDLDSRALLRAKLNDETWNVRVAAVAALANDPDDRAHFRTELAHQNWSVRVAAVAALANDPDSRALLRAMLHDPHGWVRSAAVAALANDPDSRSRLCDQLDDPDNEVRRAAIVALANDLDARVFLRDKLDDQTWDVRSAAVAALANDPDSRALLRDKLNDPNWAVRSAAVAALASDSDSRALLRATLNDPDNDVRRAAVAALRGAAPAAPDAAPPLSSSAEFQLALHVLVDRGAPTAPLSRDAHLAAELLCSLDTQPHRLHLRAGSLLGDGLAGWLLCRLAWVTAPPPRSSPERPDPATPFYGLYHRLTPPTPAAISTPSPAAVVHVVHVAMSALEASGQRGLHAAHNLIEAWRVTRGWTAEVPTVFALVCADAPFADLEDYVHTVAARTVDGPVAGPIVFAFRLGPRPPRALRTIPPMLLSASLADTWLSLTTDERDAIGSFLVQEADEPTVDPWILVPIVAALAPHLSPALLDALRARLPDAASTGARLLDQARGGPPLPSAPSPTAVAAVPPTAPPAPSLLAEVREVIDRLRAATADTASAAVDALAALAPRLPDVPDDDLVDAMTAAERLWERVGTAPVATRLRGLFAALELPSHPRATRRRRELLHTFDLYLQRKR